MYFIFDENGINHSYMSYGHMSQFSWNQFSSNSIEFHTIFSHVAQKRLRKLISFEFKTDFNFSSFWNWNVRSISFKIFNHSFLKMCRSQRYRFVSNDTCFTTRWPWLSIHRFQCTFGVVNTVLICCINLIPIVFVNQDMLWFDRFYCICSVFH